MCSLLHFLSDTKRGRNSAERRRELSYISQVPYLLASAIDFGCSKKLNHGLNHGSYLSIFKYFGWKYTLNWIENVGLKSWLLYIAKIVGFTWCASEFARNKLIFLSAQMAVLSSFLEMLIILEMYNFWREAKRERE